MSRCCCACGLVYSLFTLSVNSTRCTVESFSAARGGWARQHTRRLDHRDRCKEMVLQSSDRVHCAAVCASRLPQRHSAIAPNGFSALVDAENFAREMNTFAATTLHSAALPFHCYRDCAPPYCSNNTAVHRYPSALLAGPTSARLCHTISRDTAISEISAPHRYSPPATQQQTINQQHAACVP